MQKALVLCLGTLLALGGACKKKEGPAGPAGPEGPQGPAGPVGDPPRILDASPQWGSWRSTVTITGENFTDTAADNLVYFDGVQADVVSASTTELVVQPTGLEPDLTKTVDITVITANQASNAFAWEALASGTVRSDWKSPYAFIWEPVDIAMGPGDNTIFVADARTGVLAVDRASGKTTFLQPLTEDLLKRPLAISYNPDQGMVWVLDDRSFAGDASLVRLLEIDPANGDASVALFSNPALANAVDMVTAANGDTYVLRDQPAGDAEEITFLAGDLSTIDSTFGTVTADTDPRQMALDEDTNELHIAATAGNDLYTLDAMAGGAATAEGLAIDTPLGIVVSNMDEVQVIQGQGGTPGIKTVDLAMGMVTDYNNFTYGASFADTGAATIAAGGELYWVGSDSNDIDMFALVEAPNADTHSALTVGLTAGYIGVMEFNGAIYWDSVMCITTQDPAAFGMLMRANADGSTEVVARGTCGVGLSASTDTLFATNAIDGEVLSIDPMTGNTTTILDSSDGLMTPAGTMVDGNDLFVFDTGANVVTKSDLTGGGLDSSFVSGTAGYNGVISNGTAYVADLISGGISTFDTATGGSFSSLTGTGLGRAADIEILPDGTLVTTAIEAGTFFEVATDGTTTVIRDVGDDGLLANPTTVHRLPNGSYLTTDLESTLGDVAVVTP